MTKLSKRDLALLKLWQLSCEDLRVSVDLSCETCPFYEQCKQIREKLDLNEHLAAGEQLKASQEEYI